MRLRFLLLLWLVLGLTARAAVPVYKNDTFTLLPTNMLRSNILDSATVTWTLGPNGTMTPNVIGGNSSNAQPPSVNLSNWSTVATQALRIAKTLYVTTNGTDATAAREWTHLQFRTPGHAKTNAQAGDTIVVWPGTYLIDTNLNLAKTEVNWHVHNGAEIIRDGGGNIADSHKGIFYDHGVGAMQFTVSGHGTFIVSNGYSLALNFTNRSSRVTAVGKRWQNKSNGPLIYHGESDVTIYGYEYARADLYDLVWSEPSDGVVSKGSLYVEAPYLYAGDNLVECKSFATNGACVISARYAEAQTLNSGNTLLAGSNVTVRFDVMRTSGILTTTGTAQPPEYNIGYLEIVGNPDVPPISIGVWLRNSFVYSPGTTIPIRASAGVGGPVLLQDVSIHTGASTWVEGLGGAGGYVTNLGTFTVNSGKLPDSNVRVISHLSPGLGFSITNQIGALTLHETNGTFAVGLRAAENLTNNFTLILPTNHPTAGQVVTVRAISGQNYSLTWSNATAVGPYILDTGGSGTNTDFWGITESAGTNRMGNLAVTNRITQKIVTLAYAGTTNVTIDLSQGNIFALTATADTKFWPTNGPGAGWSQQAIVYVDMDGTGGYSFYKDDVTTETNYTSLVLTNTANAKNTLWLTSDKTGTNFQFLVNPDFRK